MSKPVAFITGASSGIGHALALEYARQGHDVVILARRAERLKQLADELQALGAEAMVAAGDVAVDGDLDKATLQALDRFGRIDVAIANAGISIAAPFERLSLDDHRRVFETNLFGVLRTARATLDPLKKQQGSFAAIGSVNGFVGLPRSSPYVASKFAVRGLCEVLYHDFGAHGVSVTHVAPGFIASEIRQVDNGGTFQPDRKDPVPPWLVMPADEAARQIVRAIRRRKREAVITLHGKAAASLARHTPGLVSSVLKLTNSRIKNDKS